MDFKSKGWLNLLLCEHARRMRVGQVRLINEADMYDVDRESLIYHLKHLQFDDYRVTIQLYHEKTGKSYSIWHVKDSESYIIKRTA